MTQAVRRAGHAPVALETRPDQALVRQVVAGEERRDALEEGRLRQRSCGREEAEDGPLDAVGQRDRGRLLVLRVAEPPATRLDLHEPPVAGPGHLVADERQEPVDRVRRRLAGRGHPERPGAHVGRRSDRAIGTAAAAGRVGVRERSRSPVRRPPRRPRRGPSGARRVEPAGGRAAALGLRGREAPELAGPIEPDEDLAEEPLVPGGLAAGAERLDGRVGHGPGRLRGRERALVEALRGGEEARAGHQVRVAGAAGDRAAVTRWSASAARAAARHPAAGTRPTRRPRRRRRRAARSRADSRRWPRPARPRRGPPGRCRRAGPRDRHGPSRAPRPPAPGRSSRPASSMGHATRNRQGRRSAAGTPRRARGPTRSRGRRCRDVPGRAGPAAGPGPGGCAAPARLGRAPTARRSARAGRTGSRARGPRSRSPPPGFAGPRRAGPGAARARRPRAAGRSRGRVGRRPRRPATGCARATGSRSGGGRGRR